MSKITIWHNPRCTKSREGLAILEENSCDTEVIKYLDAAVSANDVKELLNMLSLSARELMRTTEAIYKELNLKNETDEEKLIEAMAGNPKLIQRPIIIKDGKAIIGRPKELIGEFLGL